MYTLKDAKPKQDIICDYSNKCGTDIPIIIDNGSYQSRVGWSTSSIPELIFKNVIAKNRANRKEQDWDLLVGNDIQDIEAVRWMIRSPFDFNVVVNFLVQETLFDYAFQHLGIDTEGSVPHSIVVTEPVANPSNCRKSMSELLFEAYSVPSVAYGIDSLFSCAYNAKDDTSTTGLVVSVGFQSTHVLPLVNGKPDVVNSLRMNLGGYNCSAYLQWLLQYRQPQFIGEFTLSRMETLIHEFCSVAESYNDNIKKWSDIAYCSDHSTVVNFNMRYSTSKPQNLQVYPLNLEKKLKQAEYKLYEVECVLEIEHDNPEGAVRASCDLGCKDICSLKEYAKSLQENVDEIQLEMDAQYKSESISNFQESKFRLGVEKQQVPEILFQPSLVGYDQQGISECINTVLNCYPTDVQQTMAENVFLTGGTSCTNGLHSRISCDLQQVRPFNSKILVHQAGNPLLDAWRGAAKWASDVSNQSLFVTKQEYEEHGPDYFKAHQFSNRVCLRN